MTEPVTEGLTPQMKFILTMTGCGPACWEAKEDVCRCSCGGKNHGIAQRGGHAERTAKRAGRLYTLKAVGLDLEHLAQEITWLDGSPYWYAYGAADQKGIAAANLSLATGAQMEKWKELEPFFSPYLPMHEQVRPRLLWVRSDKLFLYDLALRNIERQWDRRATRDEDLLELLSTEELQALVDLVSQPDYDARTFPKYEELRFYFPLKDETQMNRYMVESLKNVLRKRKGEPTVYIG